MSWMTVYGIKRAKNKRRIQAYLDDAGLNQAKIAARVGMSEQLVSATISGQKHSPTVLGELRKAGVPEHLLCDPRQAEAAQAI